MSEVLFVETFLKSMTSGSVSENNLIYRRNLVAAIYKYEKTATNTA